MPFLELSDAYGNSVVCPVESPGGIRKVERPIVGDAGGWTPHDTWLSSIVGRKWDLDVTLWGLTEEGATAMMEVLEGQPPLSATGDLLQALLGEDDYAGLRVMCGPIEREFVRTKVGHRVRMSFRLREV